MAQTNLSRRVLFNEAAELYDQCRPQYPTSLVEDLVKLTGLNASSNVLEIGCGTGQLTLPLAKQGLSIIAVELGAQLAGIAKKKLKQFSRVKVVVTDFDTWYLPRDSFDLVVAATSFHWLDPLTRAEKCVRALRSEGTLAIVETHWNAGTAVDRFFIESQSCYGRWHDQKLQAPSSLPARHEELESSGMFQKIRLKHYVYEQEYSAAQYCDLLNTFSDVRALPGIKRSGFLKCIAQLIDSSFGGSIVRKHVYRVWIATAAAQE